MASHSSRQRSQPSEEEGCRRHDCGGDAGVQQERRERECEEDECSGDAVGQLEHRGPRLRCLSSHQLLEMTFSFLGLFGP